MRLFYAFLIAKSIQKDKNPSAFVRQIVVRELFVYLVNYMPKMTDIVKNYRELSVNLLNSIYKFIKFRKHHL